MKKLGFFYFLGLLFLGIPLFAQEETFLIKQENDDVLFFNEGKRAVEVWVRIEGIAVSEVVQPGTMKKFNNPDFLKPEDLENSDIYYSYSYRALESDVKVVLNDFYAEIDKRRAQHNVGAEIVDSAFYRMNVFEGFLENPYQKQQLRTLQPKKLSEFVNMNVLPESKGLMTHVNDEGVKSKANLVKEISKFIANHVKNSNETPVFLNTMNQLETLFSEYSQADNQTHDLGNLSENGFTLDQKNPGTEIGVYMITNWYKTITKFDFPDMDTRGFDFEVAANHRFWEKRVSKRRTLNLYGSASYISLKDDEYDLKKSLITFGPQLRYTGYYENQVQLIGEAGLLADITSKNNKNPEDSSGMGYYVGGEIALLFFRFGVRYYDELAAEELTPEGKVYYRIGLVAKF